MAQPSPNKVAEEEMSLSEGPPRLRSIKVESLEDSTNNDDALICSHNNFQKADATDESIFQRHAIAAHSILYPDHSKNVHNGLASPLKAEVEHFSSMDEEEIAQAAQSGQSQCPRSPPLGNFTCQQCQASFQTLIQFIDHMRVTHLTNSSSSSSSQSGSPLKCHICELHFSSVQANIDHLVEHFLTTSGAYACKKCDKTTVFASLHQLYQHFANNHTEVLYRCSICLKLFSKDTSYQAHVTSHSTHKTTFGCVACSMTFTSYDLLSIHVLSAHDAKRDLSGQMCSTVTTAQNVVHKENQRLNKMSSFSIGSKEGREPIRSTRYIQRKRRQRKSHLLFKCRICDTQFPSSQQLSTHAKIHEICLTKGVTSEK